MSPGNILDQLKQMEGQSSARLRARSCSACSGRSSARAETLKTGPKRSAGGPQPLPLFREERRVRHNAVQMFDLVADVERYPEFVPLCKALRVRSRRPETDGRETVVADMTVGYKLIRETFTSRVMLDKPNLKVRVEYIDGPFSRLENIWTFKDEPEGRGLSRRLLHRLRVQKPDARHADGLDVRRRVPQVRQRVRRAAPTRSTGADST